MSGHRLIPYQIEVLDFKGHKKSRHNDIVVSDTRGIYQCRRCGWEGQRLDRCPKCDGTLYPKGRIKVVDTLSIAPRRTLIELFYNSKRAKRWGERFGTVISCHKVDKSRYLENIEHLNLKQEPITIELEQDFVLNKALELERPRRSFEGGKIILEIDENSIDKE